MKLITEFTNNLDTYTLEEAKGSKSMFIEGIFLQGDLKNQNGRIYPFEMLQKEVKRYKESLIDESRALGELGHPMGPAINLDRVSHMIVDLKVEGKNFVGKAKVLNTPSGKIVENMIKEGVKLGVSSRGLGSVKTKRSGVQEVQNDFMLATVDVVADPSAPDAFVEGIMEGKEWVWSNGLIQEKDISDSKRAILNASSAQLNEVKLRQFANFMLKLAN